MTFKDDTSVTTTRRGPTSLPTEGGLQPRHDPNRHSYGPQGLAFSTAKFALAVAGVATLGLVGIKVLGKQSSTRTGSEGLTSAEFEPEVERSITIEDVPPEELYQRWREPDTLRRIMAPFADIQSTGEGRTRWTAGNGLGSWDMHLSDEAPGKSIRWRAEGGSALIREASVRFRKATGGRGTVVTLRASLGPPGGMTGRAAIGMLGGVVPSALASKSLHYFKALVQTGEIPTTERQPAARRDTR